MAIPTADMPNNPIPGICFPFKDVRSEGNAEQILAERVAAKIGMIIRCATLIVKEGDCFSLKTIMPSRKATRDYLSKGESDAKIDAYEQETLDAFEKGKPKSVATKAELARLKEAARATGIKGRQVNIRLSSGDLSDIQVRALEEGIPYQTLIASVPHKYVTGHLGERLAQDAGQTPRRVPKRRTPSVS